MASIARAKVTSRSVTGSASAADAARGRWGPHDTLRVDRQIIAALFFALLMVFEVGYLGPGRRHTERLERWLRSRLTLSFYLVPVPYLVRAGLLVLYLDLTGVDLRPLLGLSVGAVVGMTAVVVILGVIAVRQRQLWRAALMARPAETIAQVLYLFVVVGIIEELIFRGAFLLAAGGTIFALIGSSVACAAWHLPYYLREFGDRTPMALATAFGASLAYGVLAVATGSLWPTILIHGGLDAAGQVGSMARWSPRPARA